MRQSRHKLVLHSNYGAGTKGMLGLRAWTREWLWPYQGQDYRGLVTRVYAQRENLDN